MRSLSNIIKKNKEEKIKSYFEEDVFYPRLNNKEKELETAKKEALRITQEAEAQAGALIKKFQEEGMAKGIKEVAPLTHVLASLIREMKQFKEKAIEDLEPVVLDLAFTIAKKVIKDEVKTNPEIVRKNVFASLENLIDKDKITIQVNPQDKALLESHQKEIVKAFHDIHDLKIEASSSISPGGCYIKSERGDIDATLETQYSEITKAFGKQPEGSRIKDQG